MFSKQSQKKHMCSTSYIQKKTQTPNIIFKISIYNTKYTNNAKILSNTLSIRTFQKIKNQFLILLYIEIPQFIFSTFCHVWICCIYHNIYVYVVGHTAEPSLLVPRNAHWGFGAIAEALVRIHERVKGDS